MSKADNLRDTIGTMLMYYYQALVEDGNEDPKREIATVLPSLIGLSEAQSTYVFKEVEKESIESLLKGLSIIAESVLYDIEQGKFPSKKEVKILSVGLKNMKERLGGNNIGNQ